jgi:hypothetical protein
MSTFDYVGLMLQADALIAQFGMVAVLRRAGSSPQDRPCLVVITDTYPRDRAQQLANPTDRRVLISAATPEVQAMPPNNELDQLVLFAQPLANPPVVAEVLPFAQPVKRYAPAGVVVLYEATVRR